MLDAKRHVQQHADILLKCNLLYLQTELEHEM